MQKPTQIEQLIEDVLSDSPDGAAQAARAFDARDLKAVVIGGGTGMSTIVGGNSQRSEWVRRPSIGLKEEFKHLHVIGCTTDDGGSTGELLRYLPMIGIGDLRKSCLSLVQPKRLRRTYKLSDTEARELLHVITRVFNYRFPKSHVSRRLIRDPLLTVARSRRKRCPKTFAEELRALGAFVADGRLGPLPLEGHCMGNLLLTAAIFQAADGRTDAPPSLRAMRTGFDRIARLIGGKVGRVHPATSTPGQLRFRYANGVEVYGQRKATLARRGFAIERVIAEYAEEPRVSKSQLKIIAEADLIIFAPGSLYSSIIPVLQIPAIVEAIRKNRKALKVLVANFWIQEGETDISLWNEGRGFLASELIDAYDQNAAGGISGLFSIVLGANLEHLPGDILRGYALEGKRPIHFDRSRVEAMGYQAVEATLFSLDHIEGAQMIHHDAERFALTIRTLLYGRTMLAGPTKSSLRRKRESPAVSRDPILCNYVHAVGAALKRKTFTPASLRDVVLDLAWQNRDIHPDHLRYFDRVRVVSEDKWGRSMEWDNVLGYYEPDTRTINLHGELKKYPHRLREDLLIALGESLLGNYIESRRWIEDDTLNGLDARCYEITLRAKSRRKCFLGDAALRDYLRLARMLPDEKNERVHRIVINDEEGFLPPGLLFGLMYAWYLNNRYGGVMEYEMALLRWSMDKLIPHQAKEFIRKQALVEFFRVEVFGHID